MVGLRRSIEIEQKPEQQQTRKSLPETVVLLLFMTTAAGFSSTPDLS
jgi:hypothetical protein